MFAPWFNLVLLALESQQVVSLRLTKLALGGADAHDEANLMVSEKMKAAWLATGRLMLGDFPDVVVTSYRETVRANAERLLAAPAAQS